MERRPAAEASKSSATQDAPASDADAARARDELAADKTDAGTQDDSGSSGQTSATDTATATAPTDPATPSPGAGNLSTFAAQALPAADSPSADRVESAAIQGQRLDALRAAGGVLPTDLNLKAVDAAANTTSTRLGDVGANSNIATAGPGRPGFDARLGTSSLGQQEQEAATSTDLSRSPAPGAAGNSEAPGKARPAKVSPPDDRASLPDQPAATGTLASGQATSDGPNQTSAGTDAAARSAIGADGAAGAVAADASAAAGRERVTHGARADPDAVDLSALSGRGPGSPDAPAAAGPTAATAASLPAARTNEATASHRLDATPGSVGFGAEVGTRITTFALGGVQHARLELNPAEMGPVTVLFQLEGPAAQVHLAADHAQTRRALEQSMPQLAAALREAGLTLSGGGVFEQPRPSQQGTDDTPRREGNRAGGQAPNPATSAAPGSAPAGSRRRGVVDLVA
jgi:flagellar hook-length control protein FliK